MTPNLCACCGEPFERPDVCPSLAVPYCTKPKCEAYAMTYRRELREAQTRLAEDGVQRAMRRARAADRVETIRDARLS